MELKQFQRKKEIMITSKTETHPTIVTVVTEVSELVKDKGYLDTLNREVVEYFMNYLSNHYKYSNSKGKFAEYEFPRIPFYYHLDDKKLVFEGVANRTIFVGELQTARYKRNRYIDEGIDIVRYRGFKYRVNILGQFFRPRIKELVSKWGKEVVLNEKFFVNSERAEPYEFTRGEISLDLFSDEVKKIYLNKNLNFAFGSYSSFFVKDGSLRKGFNSYQELVDEIRNNSYSKYLELETLYLKDDRDDFLKKVKNKTLSSEDVINILNERLSLAKDSDLEKEVYLLSLILPEINKASDYTAVKLVSDESRQLIFETMITKPYQKGRTEELLDCSLPIWKNQFADTWELLNFSEFVTEKPIKLNQATLWSYSRYLEFGEGHRGHTFSQTKTDFIIDVEDLPHYLFYDGSKDVGKKLLSLSEFIFNQVSKIIISPEKVTALTSILELMQNGVLQFSGNKDEYNSRYIFLYKLLEKVKGQS